ncbi:MAG: sensor hybrid histidine kinase [Verrucomicrobia bacterium]|jgi:signal transduction histidine kinase/ActR/RegA family two-component response regulator|nr:sensor hybrid histidine kinase [Verrucomicrobiota bacterium]
MSENWTNVLGQASWPVLSVGADGRMADLNDAAVQCFGQNAKGRPFGEIWDASNQSEASAYLRQAVISVQSPTVILFKGREGDKISFSAYSCPVKAAGGAGCLIQLFQEVGTIATGNTTMFFRQPERPPNGPLDPAQIHKQKLECALQLTRTVALDFNNALTSILGHTSLILRKLQPDSPWRGSLLEVEKSAEKAAEIAHDLAVFSRQEKDTKAQVAGNLNDLLRNGVESFRGLAGNGVEWKLHLESKLYTANFEEGKMQQAVMKVLENSVQAVSKQGRITVVTRNRDVTEPTQDGAVMLAPGSYVCLEVSDSGPGIAKDILPRIFEPFFTTKYGHRGLGLAWVYGIVSNHGGLIAVSSAPGQGAAFRIYLPAQKRVVQDRVYNDDELRGNQTILMVDDEDLLLTMGEMVLSSFGYRVMTANSGQRALEILEEQGPRIDLLITDLVMPKMSGRELIEKVRPLFPYLPIICTSGYVRSKSAEDANGEVYLQKPFSSQDLLLKVKKVLNPEEYHTA